MNIVPAPRPFSPHVDTPIPSSPAGSRGRSSGDVPPSLLVETPVPPRPRAPALNARRPWTAIFGRTLTTKFRSKIGKEIAASQDDTRHALRLQVPSISDSSAITRAIVFAPDHTFGRRFPRTLCEQTLTSFSNYVSSRGSSMDAVRRKNDDDIGDLVAAYRNAIGDDSKEGMAIGKAITLFRNSTAFDTMNAPMTVPQIRRNSESSDEAGPATDDARPLRPAAAPKPPDRESQLLHPSGWPSTTEVAPSDTSSDHGGVPGVLLDAGSSWTATPLSLENASLENPAPPDEQHVDSQRNSPPAGWGPP